MSRKYTIYVRGGQNWPQFADDLRGAAGGSDFELKISDCVSADEFVLEPRQEDHGYTFTPNGPIKNRPLEVEYPGMVPSFTEEYKTEYNALYNTIRYTDFDVLMPCIIPYTEAYPVKHSLYSRLKYIAIKLLSLVKFLSK